MVRGRFITLEGIEGSGKSSHARALCRYLRRRGRAVVHVREPGSSTLGEAIRQILLQGSVERMSAWSELFLFEAARAALVEDVVRPALAKGRIVVSDRFFDATTAYQGYGAGLPVAAVERVNLAATDGLKPDLTIVLDLPVEVGLKRSWQRKGTKDRMERKPITFHRRVRQGYLTLARREPKRVKIVKVHDAFHETQRRIRELVDQVLTR